MSDSLRHPGLYSPWKSPGQNTVVGSLLLLQGIFPTQGSNSGLPHCRQILYQLSHMGSRITEPLIFSCAHLWCANNTIRWGQSRKTRGVEHHVNGSVNSKCQLLLVQRTGLVIAYCRINHHTFSTLKQDILLTFRHPWVRNPGTA